jgi:hypothetical protein
MSHTIDLDCHRSSSVVRRQDIMACRALVLVTSAKHASKGTSQARSPVLAVTRAGGRGYCRMKSGETQCVPCREGDVRYSQELPSLWCACRCCYTADVRGKLTRSYGGRLERATERVEEFPRRDRRMVSRNERSRYASGRINARCRTGYPLARPFGHHRQLCLHRRPDNHRDQECNTDADALRAL